MFLDDFDPIRAFQLVLGLELEFSIVCLYHDDELTPIIDIQLAFANDHLLFSLLATIVFYNRTPIVIEVQRT